MGAIAVSLDTWLGNNIVLLILILGVAAVSATLIWPDLFNTEHRSGEKKVEGQKLEQRRQVGLAIAGIGVAALVLVLALNPEVKCEFSGGHWTTFSCLY